MVQVFFVHVNGSAGTLRFRTRGDALATLAAINAGYPGEWVFRLRRNRGL